MTYLPQPFAARVSPRSICLGLAAAVALAAAPGISAGTWNKTAAGSFSWDTSANWTGGIPNNPGDVANFYAILAGDETINLTGADHLLTDLNIGNGSAQTKSYTIATGAFALNFYNNPTLSMSAGTQATTISGTLGMQLGNGIDMTFNNDSSNPLNIPAVINGAGNIYKTGNGLLVLSGANTFAGFLEIVAGTVRLGIDQALPSSNFRDGLNFPSGSTGTLDLNGRTQTIRGVTGNTAGGTVNVNGGSLTLISASVFNGGFSGAGTITIDGTGDGSGSTNYLQSQGNSSFSGSVSVIHDGQFSVQGNVSWPNLSSLVLSGTFSRFDYSSPNQLNSLVAVSSNPSGGHVYLNDTNQTIGSLAGDLGVTLTNTGSATLAVGANNASTSYSGKIDGTGGSLAKIGTGTLTLTSANYHTVGSSVSGGTLRVSGAGTIGYPTPALTTTSTGIFDLNGTSQTIGQLLGTGGSVLNNAAATTSTLAVGADNQNASFSGVIKNGTGTTGLTKVGGGTQILTGANTYTGPTNLSGGILEISGAGTLSTASAVTVGSGATLRLTRNDTWGGSFTATTSSPVTVQAGGTLASNNSFNSLANLNLAGGTLLANGGVNASFPAFYLFGTVTVTGSSASQFAAGAGSFNVVSIGSNQGPGSTTFDVADVTASPAVDLNVAVPLNDVTAAAGQLQSGLIKTGAGTLQLSGANTYTGSTLINGGTLSVTASGTLGSTGSITIGSGGTLDITAFGSSGFTLASGRTLTNNGTILGVLAVSGTFQGLGALTGGLTVNSGGLAASSSGTLTVTGTIINNGTMRFAGGAVLNASGVTSFVNNGVLDLITAGSGTTLPTITGSGVVLTASSVRVKTTSRASYQSGSPAVTKYRTTITFDSYAGHIYRLQRATSLTPSVSNFAAVPGSNPVAGDGTPLTVTDEDSGNGEIFYRLQLNP